MKTQRKPVCHGMPVSRCQAQRTIAPCRAVIRMCTGEQKGDSFSANPRFIKCRKCLRLGRAGKFRFAYVLRDQLEMPFLSTATAA
jgi:hypothetical protein